MNKNVTPRRSQCCVAQRVLHDFHARSTSHIVCSQLFHMRSSFAEFWCTSSEPWKVQLRVAYFTKAFISRADWRRFQTIKRWNWLGSDRTLLSFCSWSFSATRKKLAVLCDASSENHCLVCFGVAPLPHLQLRCFALVMPGIVRPQKPSFIFCVKGNPPNTENSMQYGYDENDNNNMNNKTKRETASHGGMTWRRTITCSSQSTTSTPMTTFTHMFAWCTWDTEFAHSAHSCTVGDVVSHLIGSRFESWHQHFHSHPWGHLLESLFLFYFHQSFPVFFSSFHLLHCELYPELDNLIVMESLCYSANKRSDDAYDVSTSLALWGGSRLHIVLTGSRFGPSPTRGHSSETRFGKCHYVWVNTHPVTPAWRCIWYPVMGNYCGVALGHIDVLMDQAREPRRLCLQVLVNDAEHRLRLLLLHCDILDIGGIPDKENPLWVRTDKLQ